MKRCAILAAMVMLSSGPAASAALPTKAQAEGLVNSCISLYEPLDTSITHSRNSVKVFFSRFPAPRWTVGVNFAEGMSLYQFSRVDPGDGNLFIVRAVLKTIPNDKPSPNCGPNRLLLTRLLVWRGDQKGEYTAQQIIPALLVIEP